LESEHPLEAFHGLGEIGVAGREADAEMTRRTEGRSGNDGDAAFHQQVFGERYIVRQVEVAQCRFAVREAVEGAVRGHDVQALEAVRGRHDEVMPLLEGLAHHPDAILVASSAAAAAACEMEAGLEVLCDCTFFIALMMSTGPAA